jgi:vitamin B12/bleomycin/antimicrobial peptide transport system ATP-binding/permease protein
MSANRATEAPSLVPSGLRGWGNFLIQFAQFAGPFWRSKDRRQAIALTAGLTALTFLQVAIPVALNVWIQNLFDALARRSMPQFLSLLAVLFAIIVSNVVVMTTHLRVRRRVQVAWRDWLTHVVCDTWMKAGRHYQLTFIPGEHDNPDARIAEDLRISTEYAVDLAHSLLYSVVLAASFTGILWTLSVPIQLPFGGPVSHLPGHLVWIALIYSGFGSAIALLLGRPLVRATDQRQTCEANFRFGLAHAREHGSAIALAGGEANERQRFHSLFREVIRSWNDQTQTLVNIFYYQSSWSVLSQVFPILVAAPHYIAGAITLGVLMQISQAFQQMTAGLSWPVDNLAKLADWRASVERVLGLQKAAQALAEHRLPEGRRRIELCETDEMAVTFHDVSLENPDGSEAIRTISASIRKGDRVFVGGELDAAGKLFKAVAGLWPWGQGRIDVPRGVSIFVLPELPYIPTGTLRAAIAYPEVPERFSKTAVEAALRHVGLAHLIGRLEEVESWETAIPASEHQLLGFARLLLHRPDWIFLEEATDALEPEVEKALMQLVRDQLPQATLVTAGHHRALEAFHSRKVMMLRQDGIVVVREEPAS